MSSGGDKLAMFPSRMNIALMKTRLVGAKKGHELLKKKADALQVGVVSCVQLNELLNR